MRSTISVSRKFGPRFASSSGGTGTGCAAGDQRPAHRVVISGTVGEDEAVEAVVRLLGVAAGPGRALRPAAEGGDLGMSASEFGHRVGLLARGCDLEFVESLDARDGEERRIDHRHAPFLAVRRRDHEAQAPHALLGIVGVRVRRAEIEAPDHGILTLGEDLSVRQLRSGAVRLEHAGEANSFGVIAPVAERRAGGAGEAVDQASAASGARAKTIRPCRRRSRRRRRPRRRSARAIQWGCAESVGTLRAMSVLPSDNFESKPSTKGRAKAAFTA